MRAVPLLLLLHFLAVTLAPAWVVADFLVERGRIERELCVQRLVPEDMRTCHGECQLKKRLDQSDRQERNLPDELRALRIGDMIAGEAPLPLDVSPEGKGRAWGLLKEGSLEGHPRALAPVPWC